MHDVIISVKSSCFWVLNDSYWSIKLYAHNFYSLRVASVMKHLVCICVYACTCIFLVHASAYICIHISVCSYECAYICICMCVCICTHVHIRKYGICVHIQVFFFLFFLWNAKMTYIPYLSTLKQFFKFLFL